MRRRIKAHDLSPNEIQSLAEDIYIYGYPLVLMDVAKRTQTATPNPTLHSAPLNQFAHGRFLADPHDKHTVHANADCLRSSAWLDLGKDAVILTIPRSPRHHLLSFFSAWHEIFETDSPRNAAAHGNNLGLAGPRWRGRLPAGVKRIVAPTDTVWIEAWLEADGAEDLELVHHVQDEFHLTPLSEWGTPPRPHGLPFRADVDQKASPAEQVDRLDARDFYTRLSRLMRKNPAPAGDEEIVPEFALVGFFPGEDFIFEMLPVNTAQAMRTAVAASQLKLSTAEKTAGTGKTLNHWSLHAHPGRYGRKNLERAVAARSGVTSALAEDVLCFHTAVDQTGKPLSGANRYVINFSHDGLPPAEAFWSITLYDSKQHLVPNEIHRNVIGNRNRLRHNPDNSLSVFIQRDWPGTTSDSNWLPSPKDTFNLALRLYWPKPSALAANWRPPAVTRTN